MTPNLNALTRRVTLTWLDTLRLPLAAAERVAKRAGKESALAPPTLAFDSFEASVKEFVARATGDDKLQTLAQLQRAEIDQRGEAIALKVAAEATRAETLEEAEQREAVLQRQREEAARRTAEKERQAEQERLASQKRVAEQAAAREATEREASRKRDDLLADQARRAEASALQAEAEALEVKARAVKTRGDVLKLDKAVRAKKAARKTR